MSFYWVLPTYLPLADGWTTEVVRAVDGVEVLSSSVTDSSFESIRRDDFVARARYVQVPTPDDLSIAVASGVAKDVGLPHSADGDLDQAQNGRSDRAPEWAAFVIESDDDDEESSETDLLDEPSSLSHLTVVHLTAAVSAAPDPEEVADAFDRCCELVHSTHRALHAVSGLGFVLPQPIQESLGPVVGLDVVVDGRLEARWPLGVFMTTPPWLHGKDRLTEAETEALPKAELDAEQRAPRALVSDLTRQAVGAGRRTGDYRTAIVMSATACEAWTDLVISCLLWEEGLEPDQAATEMGRYRDSLERVKRLLAPRLGGGWDMRRIPALAGWRRHVAEARNVVVHSGALPTIGAANAAIDAMYDFLTLTLDRLCAGPTRNRYPMTALFMANRIGLEQRNGWTTKMRRAADEADLYALRDAFAQWHSVYSNMTMPEWLRRTPSEETAVEVFVILADGTEYWALQDLRSGLSALGEVRAGNEPEGILCRAAAAGSWSGSSASFTFDEAPTLRRVSEWMPDHRILPNCAVMRDWSQWPMPSRMPLQATVVAAPRPSRWSLLRQLVLRSKV